jgi:hypothetical protein
MPQVADGVGVRYVDVAAPWLVAAGGDAAGDRLQAAVVARISLRYDETKADLVHDQEYECVITPLVAGGALDGLIAVDYDERDLRDEPLTRRPVYRMTDAPIATNAFFNRLERDLKDHLYRTMTVEIPVNPELKLYGRPGEDAATFGARCVAVADEQADAEVAKLRDTYEDRVARLRDQIDAASDRVDVLEHDAASKRNTELLSTAGSVLGGLLGGRSRSSILGKLGTAAGRRGRTNAAAERLDAAENKVTRLQDDLADLEADLADDVRQIVDAWQQRATAVDTMQVGLEKTDIQVTEVVLAWLPAS